MKKIHISKVRLYILTHLLLIKIFLTKRLSYKKINIKKEVIKYLAYKHWTPREKIDEKNILGFAIKKAEKDFNKKEILLADTISWELYTRYCLTKVLYDTFDNKLPKIFLYQQNPWILAESVELSEDGNSITIITKGGKKIVHVEESYTITMNGKEYKFKPTDDNLCFSLIYKQYKEQSLI